MSQYNSFAWYYDSLTKNVDYQLIANRLDQLVERFGGQKGVLLELGCGTGSVCELMTQKNYDVIGIDTSEDMLNMAMDKKFESGSDIQYLRQDMTEIDMYGDIDVTISVLDCINHLPDKNAVQKTFNGVSRFASNNGLFIFDVNTIYKHREVLADNAFVYDLDGLFCSWQNEYNPEDDSVEIFLDFFEEQENGLYERYEENFKEIALSEKDIEEMLAKSGFEVLGKYNDYTYEPINNKTERIVYVAKKISKEVD